MSEDPRELPGCNDPRVGRLLEDYLERRLTEADEVAFEEHYFRCPVCLEEIQLRQSLPGALGASKGARPPLRATALWPSVAAGILLLLLAYPAWLGIYRFPAESRRADDLQTENLRLSQEARERQAALDESRRREPVASGWTGPASLVILTGAARGDEAIPVVKVRRGQPYVPLAAKPSLPPGLAGTETLTFEIHREGGPAVWTNEMTGAALREEMKSSRVVTFLIPSRTLMPGRHELSLRSSGGSAAPTPKQPAFTSWFDVVEIEP